MLSEPDEEDSEVEGTAGHGETMPYSAVPCPACGAASNEPLVCGECGASLRRSLVRAPGSVLGSYRLIDVIGEGGMGVVYVAEHTRLGRKVAIKTLRSEYSNNALAVRRFFSEARAVNRICHQNIVEITDFVEHPGADNYYIMELLQGTTLARVIDHAGATPIPVERSVAIMVQVAAALEAVHAAGIIHRDLKPDNVFLIERGGNRDFVKVLDFGVAKLIETPDQVSVHQTAAGQILGTPEYMSPEQASAKPVTTQTDVYSFGVLLYELVTGRRPVTGKSFGEIVVKHLTATPIPTRKVKGVPHDIPVELDDLILACLAKEPGDRPQGMHAVTERLEAIAEAYGWPLASSVDVPRPSGRMSTMPRLHKPDGAARRRRIGLAIAAVAAAALAVAVVAVVVGSDRDPPPPTTPPSIEIELVTTPPGAEVRRGGVAVGRTPLRFETAVSARPEFFELRLDGYETATREIQLDRRSRLDITLVRIPAPAPPPAPAAAAAPQPAAAPAAPPTTRRDRGGAKNRGTKPRPGSGSGSADASPPPASPPPPQDRSGVLDPFAPN